tara:strand:- start:1719 stop:2201 length:483 start_codon:yes stop_codon:yes gene_type:complete
MIVNFKNELNNKSVGELIKKLDEVNKEDGPHTLYFSSVGGFSSSTELLLHYLNNNCLEWNLVANHELMSNGFVLFAKFKGPKLILKETEVMLHLFGFSINTRDDVKNEDNLKRAKLDLKESNKELLKLYKSIKVPNKYIKRIKKGEDVMLYYEDFKKFKL